MRLESVVLEFTWYPDTDYQQQQEDTYSGEELAKRSLAIHLDNSNQDLYGVLGIDTRGNLYYQNKSSQGTKIETWDRIKIVTGGTNLFFGDLLQMPPENHLLKIKVKSVREKR